MSCKQYNEKLLCTISEYNVVFISIKLFVWEKSNGYWYLMHKSELRVDSGVNIGRRVLFTYTILTKLIYTYYLVSLV